MQKPENVNHYISMHAGNVQKILIQLRDIVRKTAPDSLEVISYGMPAYKLNGMLVWFAAHSSHIGFYPGSSVIEAFKTELSKFKNAKGSVQFPLVKPLPVKIVKDMIKFKMMENRRKLAFKKKK
jgi:uncharacterized protein YdhG (YjbR/CyaY superfamily)